MSGRGAPLFSIPIMPTTLTLKYTAYSTITVPNNIANKLKEAQTHEECAQAFNPKKPWTFGNIWGSIFYTDDEGVEHTIDGVTSCDFKKTDDCEWDAEEAEEEEEEEKEAWEAWEEIYNSTEDMPDNMPGVSREYSGQPGTFYQTYGNGGGPGGSGGYWVREGGRAVWMVEGNKFSFIAGAILEVVANSTGFQRCRIKVLIK